MKVFGLVLVCSDVLSPVVVMFTVFNSVAFHSILPFHSAAIMIGASKGYFPASYVAKLGIPVTLIIFISTIYIFIPWWKYTGLM